MNIVKNKLVLSLVWDIIGIAGAGVLFFSPLVLNWNETSSFLQLTIFSIWLAVYLTLREESKWKYAALFVLGGGLLNAGFYLNSSFKSYSIFAVMAIIVILLLRILSAFFSIENNGYTQQCPLATIVLVGFLLIGFTSFYTKLPLILTYTLLFLIVDLYIYIWRKSQR